MKLKDFRVEGNVAIGEHKHGNVLMDVQDLHLLVGRHILIEKRKGDGYTMVRLRSSYTIGKKHLSNHHGVLAKVIMRPPRGFMVDHISRDTMDNRRCNLRVCTRSQNLMNSVGHNGSASKFKGVTFDKRPQSVKKPWRARVQAGDVFKFIGMYPTEAEAALAYNEAAKKLHGEFALLNNL